ncbi:hypothetical protein FRC17_004437 [Serendipita sp. 399]|nr:hypothetical protein FRC17_004437 [Serendipita sp. 399]
MYIAATQTGYLECLDKQRAAAVAGNVHPLQRTVSSRTNKTTKSVSEKPDDQEAQDGNHGLDGDDVAENLRNVAERLRRELGSETPARPDATAPGTPTHGTSPLGESTAVPTAGTSRDANNSPTTPLTAITSPPKADAKSAPEKHKYGPSMIKQHFEEFELAQKDVLIDILTSSEATLNSSLRVHEPGPSISELYGGDFLRGDVEEGDLPEMIAKRRKASRRNTPLASTAASALDVDRDLDEDDDDDTEEKKMKSKRDGDDNDSSIGPTPEFKRNETLVRVYSLLFAWDGFVETLNAMHKECTGKRRSRLHFHVYESLVRPGKKPMPDIGLDEEEEPEESQEEARELSIKEALALLENKKYTPQSRSIIARIVHFNKWLQSDVSVFAAKSAAAASVFATLIFASTTKQWFINYGLTSGLLTCVVALAPTLGQSLLTFILQISGSGLGTLVGWAILEMFKNVGGYGYNPYGMCAILGVFALPLQYCIYERPQLFVLSLLALNSAAVITATENIYVDYYHRTGFDSPALRAGKTMVALAVALGIVIIFQLFVLRNPARRTLRKELGNLVYANLAYNTILQAYVRAVLPADPKQRGRPMILRRIERELKHREAKMQMQIIDITTLMAFAAAEPSFTSKFRGDLAQTIVQANQIILDRLREARAAIGAEPFDPYILENMVAVLSPYRRRATRINKTGLYLCAMSLMSKSPLPHESIFTQHLLNHFVHDALLISSKLARSKEGAKAIRSDSFTRYWFYLISVSGIPTQLRSIDTACKSLFGELEDDPKIQ